MTASTLSWEIAQTAARIMHEQRLQDYGLAKRKALASLNLPDNYALPENQLVNQALKEQLSLFASAADNAWRQRLLKTATQACAFLQDFKVYIGGSLASGTAKDEDRLELHIYSDQCEELLWQLQSHHIPYREQERVVRISRQHEQTFPCFSFVADQVPVSITVFPDRRPQPRPCDSDGSVLERLKPTQLSNYHP